MKKILISLFVGSVLFFSGCSDKKVAEVKDGVLKLDKTLTVGEAFDNYKYCKDVKWESGKTDNGREFVQVTCNYDFNNKDNSKEVKQILKANGVKKLEVIYQFDILKSSKNQFKLRGEYLDSYDKNGKKINHQGFSLINSLSDLKKIYNNIPLS